MGGWVSLFGDISDFGQRLDKFKNVFSPEGVSDLKVEVFREIPGMMTVCWAWNKTEIPDVYVKKQGDSILVLCGVITDIGRFGSPSATQNQTAERVLELWQKYGEEIISQLNGSFSCLFFNLRTKKAAAFTDRFASRSVWMSDESGIWTVGNFPSAVAVFQKKRPKINPVGLWSLFHTGRHLGIHGLYHNMRALLAGTKVCFSPGCNSVLSQWWKRRYTPQNSLSASQWGKRLAETLTKSANRYRNVCKRPVLFLSGGLDSRIVAAAFRNPLKALILCSLPNAESRLATLVSRVTGIEHQVIVRSPFWYLDTLKAASLISSGNFLTYHTHFIVPVQNVSSVKPESEFFLGDLLENFNKHYFLRFSKLSLLFNPENLKDFFVTQVPYTLKDVSRIGIYFNYEMKRVIEDKYDQALKEYAQPLIAVSENHADRFDTFLRWADVSVTPTYNMFTCIWPLACERNIYFDNELDELSLKIPAELRGAGKLHKWILYHLDKKLCFIPEAYSFFPPFLSTKAKYFTKKIRPLLGKIRRSKVFKKGSEPRLNTSGSWVINEEIYRKDPRFRALIEELIIDESSFPREIFNFDQIQETWQKYLAGDTRGQFEIEVLLSFGILNKIISFDGIAI